MDFEIINATTTEELLAAITNNQDKNFRIGAGYTDLILELKNQSTEGLTVINIAQLNDPSFLSIRDVENHIILGALTTASDLVNNKMIRTNFPVLYEAALSVASTQIRNLATIGGNVCNASPSADMSAALVALQAKCIILDALSNEREEPLVSFIQGVRKTSLTKKEVLKSISFPKNAHSSIRSGFEKVGVRKSMEISIVSLSYHIQIDSEGIIQNAGISCGAVAPTIPFASNAATYLIGKKINDISNINKTSFAQKVVEYATPISDIRASDWYRREVLFNISQTIFE